MKKLYFAHANGFPARTYAKFFSFLEDAFEIGFTERLAHDPRFPVTDGWHHLRDELRRDIEARFDVPVVGVGHSLGGVLHLMVAAERPELYERIVLLDAPVISRLSSHGLRFLKYARLIDTLSPARMTRFRRNFWQTRDEAFRHFHAKPKFRAFDESALRDYVEYGLTPDGDGFSLFFKPSVEARIYATIPHHLPRLRGRLKVPTAFVGGTHSEEARLARTSFMKKHFPFEFRQIEGSHLFPFEKPKATAEIVRELADRG